MPPFRAALARTFSSLQVRNYRLFWTGQLVSLGGTWMQEVAQAWLVLQLSDSPVALGLTLTLRFLPSLVLTLLVGPLADRLPKRNILLATQTVLLLQALALAVLTSLGIVRLGHIYLISLIRGVADAVDLPTRQAFVADMVGPQDLGNAVALNSTQFNVARVAGPALGGLIIAAFGVAVCFWLNAASFLAVLGALLLMRPQELRGVSRERRGRVLSEIRAGMAYAARTPDMVLVLMLVAVLATFGYNFQVLLPLLARYVLDSGPTGLGVLSAALGGGSALAGIIVAARGRPTRRNLLLGAAGFSSLLFLLGFVPSQSIAVVVLLGIGMCGVIFMTTANTRLQLLSPDHLRGRVMSIYIFLFVGSTPLGSFSVGWLAEHTGVRASVVQVGTLCLLGVLVAGIYGRKMRARGRLSPVLAALDDGRPAG
jgi:MFS family permease